MLYSPYLARPLARAWAILYYICICIIYSCRYRLCVQDIYILYVIYTLYTHAETVERGGVNNHLIRLSAVCVSGIFIRAARLAGCRLPFVLLCLCCRYYAAYGHLYYLHPGGTLLQKSFKIRSWVPSTQMP